MTKQVTKIMKVPIEMIEILDILRDNIRYYAYDSLKLSNTEMLRVLAKKVTEAGLVVRKI